MASPLTPALSPGGGGEERVRGKISKGITRKNIFQKPKISFDLLYIIGYCGL
jgi:hypothetical protein